VGRHKGTAGSSGRVHVLVAAALGGAAFAVFALLGIPGASLFAGAVAGFWCAVKMTKPRLHPFVRLVSLTIVGCAAGAMVDRDVLRLLAGEPVLTGGGVALTLILTMAFGQLLLLSPHVDPLTAALSSVAGGASGVSAVAGELGADERIVLTVQYLRVVMVLASVPLIVPMLAPGPEHGIGATERQASWAISGAVIVASVLLAKVVRFSASSLLVPLAIAAALSVSEVVVTAATPVPLQEAAFAAVGLMVGLSFDHQSISTLRTIAWLAVTQSLLGMGACAVAAYFIARASDLSLLDAYLATTPGGLPAVLAAAVSSGANVGVITAMQVARVVASLVLAPLIGRWLPGREATSQSGSEGGPEAEPDPA
jgi:membrane AbrB-like protein